MNRHNAQESQKSREVRVGKNEAEVEALDREDALNAKIAQLAREFHY